MNTDSHNQQPTMGEFMHKSKVGSIKAVSVAVAAMFLMAGVIYTGIHNFNLYRHALPPGQEVFGLIPVILIEGSIVLFIVGGFVWFSSGTQKIVATVAGWLLFGIAAFNTLVDSTQNVGADTAMPDWLHIYAQYGVFVIPVLIMAVLKLIFDLDPAKRQLDMQKAIEHALSEAKFAAAQRALMSEVNRAALNEYGDAFGASLANHIRNSSLRIGPVIDAESKPVAKPATQDTPQTTEAQDDGPKA